MLNLCTYSLVVIEINTMVHHNPTRAIEQKKWEIKIIDTYNKKYTWKEGKNKTKYNSEPDQDMNQKQVDIPLKWSR